MILLLTVIPVDPILPRNIEATMWRQEGYECISLVLISFSTILKDIMVISFYLWYVTNSPVPATKTKKRVELVPWSRAPTNAPRFLEPSPGGDWSNIVIKYEFAYQWQFSILMWLIQTQFNAKFFLSFASCKVQNQNLYFRLFLFSNVNFCYCGCATTFQAPCWIYCEIITFLFYSNQKSLSWNFKSLR